MIRNAVLATLLALAIPLPASAQEWGFGARLGTLGWGVDASWALNELVSFRGGFGFIHDGFFLTELLPADIEGIESTFELPATSFTLGVDVKISGPFRVMGGILVQTDDLVASGELQEETEIGNGLYGPGGLWTLTLDQVSVMPYAGIGFGTVPSSGFGVYVDLALAFGGDGEIFLSASEELTSQPGFNEDLLLQQEELNEESGALKSLYPVLQVGVRYGLGR